MVARHANRQRRVAKRNRSAVSTGTCRLWKQLHALMSVCGMPLPITGTRECLDIVFGRSHAQIARRCNANSIGPCLLKSPAATGYDLRLQFHLRSTYYLSLFCLPWHPERDSLADC